MAYLLADDIICGYRSVWLSDLDGLSSLGIIPDLGGMMLSLKLSKGTRSYQLLSGPPQDDYFLSDYLIKFQGANLLPFPNRIKNGQYSFNQISYQFEKNGAQNLHAIHGLVYNRKFSIHEFNPQDGLLSICIRSKGSQAYPFSFQQIITFKLDRNSLSINTCLDNLENKAIPIAHGWHPYFTLGTKVDNIELVIPGQTYLEVDETGIPTGKRKQLDRFLSFEKIEDLCLDHCFILDENQNKTMLRDPDSELMLQIEQSIGDNQYKFVQYYIPPDRKSIAIEPMTCIPDAFNQNQASCILAAHESMNLEMCIKIV